MEYNVDNNFSFTRDLRDDDGDIWAAISVIPSKEVGKRDILLMDVQEGNISVRSITELLNLFKKRKFHLKTEKKLWIF